MNLIKNRRNNLSRVSIQQVMDCISDGAAAEFNLIAGTNIGNGCQALIPGNAQNIISVLNEWFNNRRFKFVQYPTRQAEPWEAVNSSTGGGMNPNNCLSKTTTPYEKFQEIYPNVVITASPLDVTTNGITKMKDTIDRYGPILINIETTGTLNPVGGEITSCNTIGQAPGLHSMIIYGYDTTHWYVRNSWTDPLPAKFRIGANACNIESLNLIFYLEDNYFILKVNYNTGLGKALYISGSNDRLGNWTSAHKLTNMSASIWEFRVIENEVTGAQYKIILSNDAEQIVPVDNTRMKWETPEGSSGNKSFQWTNGIMNHTPNFPN